MLKIYVLMSCGFGHYEDDWTYIEGVFTTKDAAREHAVKLIDEIYNNDNCYGNRRIWGGVTKFKNGESDTVSYSDVLSSYNHGDEGTELEICEYELDPLYK